MPRRRKANPANRSSPAPKSVGPKPRDETFLLLVLGIIFGSIFGFFALMFLIDRIEDSGSWENKPDMLLGKKIVKVEPSSLPINLRLSWDGGKVFLTRDDYAYMSKPFLSSK